MAKTAFQWRTGGNFGKLIQPYACEVQEAVSTVLYIVWNAKLQQLLRGRFICTQYIFGHILELPVILGIIWVLAVHSLCKNLGFAVSFRFRKNTIMISLHGIVSCRPCSMRMGGSRQKKTRKWPTL